MRRQDNPDVIGALRLARHRDQLTDRNTNSAATRLCRVAGRRGVAGGVLFSPVGVAHGDALGSERSPDGAAIDTEPLADAGY